MDQWAKYEAKMAEETLIAVAAANAKNALEAYVYDARDKLYASWAPYLTESDSATFSALLDETGDWLYGEGEDETRAVYEQKLLALRALGDPIEFRLQEHNARDAAVAHFEKVHTEYMEKATDSSEKYEHITPEEKHKIVAEIEKNRAWFNPLAARQAEAKVTDDPAFHSRDLYTRCQSLAKLADPILNKPKPKPKPVETPKPEEKPAPTATEQPAEDSKMATDQPSPTPTPEGQMEVD